MERVAPSAWEVTVTALDLPRNATSLVDSVVVAATRCGGHRVVGATSADDTTLTVDFVVHAPDEDAAREAGQSVRDAVGAESFVWSVAVLKPFSR